MNAGAVVGGLAGVVLVVEGVVAWWLSRRPGPQWNAGHEVPDARVESDADEAELPCCRPRGCTG